jgi:hypothetical protein
MTQGAAAQSDGRCIDRRGVTGFRKIWRERFEHDGVILSKSPNRDIEKAIVWAIKRPLHNFDLQNRNGNSPRLVGHVSASMQPVPQHATWK